MPQLREAVGSLSGEQLWQRPNESSNNIGNLLLCLNGSSAQWLVNSFEARDIHRDRPAEFSAHEGATTAELLDRLIATVEEASRVLARRSAELSCITARLCMRLRRCRKGIWDFSATLRRPVR